MAERRVITGPDRPPYVIFVPTPLAGVVDYGLIYPEPLSPKRGVINAVGLIIEETFSSTNGTAPTQHRRTYFTSEHLGAPGRPEERNIFGLKVSEGRIIRGIQGKERETIVEGPAYQMPPYDKIVKADNAVTRLVAAGVSIDVPEPGVPVIEATIYIPESIYDDPRTTQEQWRELRLSVKDAISGFTRRKEVALTARGDEDLVMELIESNYVLRPNTITRLNGAGKIDTPEAATAARFERRFVAAA